MQAVLGRVVCALDPSGSVVGASGTGACKLVPNDAILPANTYWLVTLSARAGTLSASATEKWSVTTSLDPVAIGSITRLDTVPGLRENLDNLSDVIIASPVTNQCIVYNGTAWVNTSSCGGGHVIKSNGTTQTTRANLNFKTNLRATDNSGTGATDVEVDPNGTVTIGNASSPGTSGTLDATSAFHFKTPIFVGGTCAGTELGDHCSTGLHTYMNRGGSAGDAQFMDSYDFVAKGDSLWGTGLAGYSRVVACATGSRLVYDPSTANGVRCQALQVNATPLGALAVINFSGTTPGPAANGLNVLPQIDGSGNFSLYVPMLSISKVGTLTAGTWNASTIGLANGGTNQTSWTSSRCVQVNAAGTALESASGACGSGGGISATDKQVIFMDGTTASGDAEFQWDKTLNQLTLGSGTAGNFSMVDQASACTDPAAGSTSFCFIGGKLFIRDTGATSREVLSTAGGDYGELTCAAGTCTIDSGSIPFSELTGSIADSQTPDDITIDGGDAGSGTTRSGAIIKLSTHNTDCTTRTDGKQGEICTDEDDQKVWVCIPTAGDCSGSEWKQVNAAGGGSGDITDVFNCTSGDCASISMADGDFLDGSAVNVSGTSEGVKLPQAASCASGTAEGQICWDTDDDRLMMGDGAAAVRVGSGSTQHFKQIGTSPVEVWYWAGLQNGNLTASGAMTTNQLTAFPIYSGRGGTIDRIGTRVTALSASTSIRMCLYDSTSDVDLSPNNLLSDTGTFDTSTGTGSTGVKSATVSIALKPNSVYWLATWSDGAPSIRRLPIANAFPILGMDNTLNSNNGWGWFRTPAFSTCPNPFGAASVVTSTNDQGVAAVRFSN